MNQSVVYLFSLLLMILPSTTLTSSTTPSLANIEVSSDVGGWELNVKGCAAPSCPNLPPKHQNGPPQKGITLSVLDQRTAVLIFHKVFPLWKYWAHWADLAWHIHRIAAGRIVVLAVAQTGTVGLRHVATHLAHLGAILVPHLPPRARWTWVFIKGGRTIYETAVLEGSAHQHAHTTIVLCPLPPLYISSISKLEKQRWEFCGTHGVLNGLCDEHNPDPLPVPAASFINEGKTLAAVPVVLTAGNRYQYLYHSLSTLLAAPGALQHNLLVVLGDTTPSTINLLSLLNITSVKLPVYGTGNTKLFRYYRDVFTLITKRFPDAPAAIILDEDVEVSPDFFSYMSQTLWLLKVDPSLYCINAHSSGGFKALAHDDTRVFRGSVQVEWGYAISMDFVREAVDLWHNNTITSVTFLYDFWLYMQARHGRECVFPEVSRSRHFGMGVNTNAYIKENGPLSMPLVRHTPVALHNVNRLQLSTWRHDITKAIQAATVLEGNPCTNTFLPSPPFSAFYVFYYRLDKLKGGEGRPVPYQYFHTAECLGTWSLSEQGHHEGVRIIRFAGNATLLTVGIPFSPYSDLWKRSDPLWDIDSISEQEYEEMNVYRQKNISVANQNMTSLLLVEMLVAYG